MKSVKPAEPAIFVPDHIDCEMWGQGGSFQIIDGKRVRVPDEGEAAPAAALAPVAPAKASSPKSTAGDK